MATNKYEYKRIHANTVTPESAWQEVEVLGEEGWELVAVGDAHGSPTFYLKRLA